MDRNAITRAAHWYSQATMNGNTNDENVYQYPRFRRLTDWIRDSVWKAWVWIRYREYLAV